MKPSVISGEQVQITVTVTAPTTASAVVDLEMYNLDATGQRWQQALQHVWDDEDFVAGQRRQLATTWTVPDNGPPTTHYIKVGVFGVGWTTLYSWNDNAAEVAVTSSASTTTSTSTTVPRTTTTSTTSQPPTTTPASTTPPTSAPPSGSQFSESFATAGSFEARFDHGWSGEVDAGALFGAAKNDWQGDHDGMCGDPLNTHRTIHVTASPKNVEQAFYQCAPGGDAAKAHVMTSVNTEGYVVAWFSPRAVLNNVHRVCWDQNFTHLGGGKWTTVTFLTPAEYQGKTDLGYNTPEFADTSGPHVPNGASLFGVETGRAGLTRAWQNGNFTQEVPAPDLGNDHATRVQTCVVDNENGTLTITQGTRTSTVAGQIPNGQIRVVFNDDNYNPDKHYDLATNDGATPPPYRLTWHWDNIAIS